MLNIPCRANVLLKLQVHRTSGVAGVQDGTYVLGQSLLKGSDENAEKRLPDTESLRVLRNI